MSKIALIAGSSGLVGSYLLEFLLDSGKYDKVISLVRTPSGKSNPILRERLVAYSDLLDMEWQEEITDVFCCLGTTMKKAGSKEAFLKVDKRYPEKLADFGLAHGAKRYFKITALGADSKSSVFYNKVKGKVENSITTKAYESIGIFRPSLITGPRKESRLGEDIMKGLMSLINPILIGGLSKYKSVEAEQIAKAMLILSGSDFTGKRVVESEEIEKIATSGIA